MRQDQVLDVGVGRDLANHGGRHVEASLQADHTFGYGVVSDEEISAGGELREAAFAIRVSAEDEDLLIHFDAPSQGGNTSVNYADG